MRTSETPCWRDACEAIATRRRLGEHSHAILSRRKGLSLLRRPGCVRARSGRLSQLFSDDCHGEVEAAGDRYDPRQAGRNRIALDVVAPGDDRVVRLEGEAMPVAGIDGGDARETGRYRDLPVLVATPRDHRPVRLEGEAVQVTGGNRRYS